MATLTEMIGRETAEMETLLDDITENFRPQFQLSDRPDATHRARGAIRELLREIREIVRTSPVKHKKKMVEELVHGVRILFSSFGIPLSISTATSGDLTVTAVMTQTGGDQTPPSDRGPQKHLQQQYEKAMEHVFAVGKHALGKRTASEMAYRLERSMEAATRSISDIRR